MIHFAIDFSKLEKNKFTERVLLITNNSIMFIQELHYMKIRILLREVRGQMIYFYEKKQNSINLELENGKVAEIITNDPEKNSRFLMELKKYLKQLSKQEALKNRNHLNHLGRKPAGRQTMQRQETWHEYSFERWQGSDDSLSADGAEFCTSEEEEKQMPKKFGSPERKQAVGESRDGVPSSLLEQEYHDSDYTVESYYEYDDEVDPLEIANPRQ